jgi:nucleoid-associated protein YgaU
MGLLSFIKTAGEKLFGHGAAKDATEAAAADPSPEKIAEASNAAGAAIEQYIRSMDLDARDLMVGFDSGSGIVTVSGVAADEETREKIILCCGNVSGVAGVADNMEVEASGDGSQYYTVVSGDTLSKIAKEYYGNASKYMPIFEANKPMLSHPDKIYPGQMLRIPPQ